LRLPRDLSGVELAKLLRRYGYDVSRQTGSHVRLTSNLRGVQHPTIPAHKSLKVGTLGAILSEVALYLEIERSRVEEELFSQ